jgi:hypothetical protein
MVSMQIGNLLCGIVSVMVFGVPIPTAVAVTSSLTVLIAVMF